MKKYTMPRNGKKGHKEQALSPGKLCRSQRHYMSQAQVVHQSPLVFFTSVLALRNDEWSLICTFLTVETIFETSHVDS